MKNPPFTEPPRPIPNAYWVVPGRFLAGEHPAAQGPEAARSQLGALLGAGLSVFVDLMPEVGAVHYASILEDEAAQRKIEVRQHRFGIQDLGVPSAEQMRRTLDTLDIALAEGRNIYLHCWAGIGRTGTTVGCYLVRHGLSGDEALAQLASWWRTVPKSAIFRHSPETESQAAYVRNWPLPASL